MRIMVPGSTPGVLRRPLQYFKRVRRLRWWRSAIILDVNDSYLIRSSCDNFIYPLVTDLYAYLVNSKWWKLRFVFVYVCEKHFQLVEIILRPCDNWQCRTKLAQSRLNRALTTPRGNIRPVKLRHLQSPATPSHLLSESGQRCWGRSAALCRTVSHANFDTTEAKNSRLLNSIWPTNLMFIFDYLNIIKSYPCNYTKKHINQSNNWLNRWLSLSIWT